MNKLEYKHEYHQTLTYKISCGQKPDTVIYTFEDCLRIIENIHRLTCGLKQIVYLTGWQYDGHDSKYPAFFEVNHRLRRPCDSDARQSFLWLIEEAKKFNAVVSTHINLCDAYENSPLWDEYVKKDLLVREADGSLQKGGIWDGDQSYRVSKTREWAAGETQKRIDRFLDLLPIAEAGTVHIDAFFPKPSPYHGTTMEDEVTAIQEIIKYWHTKGVDVTGELFIHGFAGFLPMAYHLNLDESSRLKYPPSVICGGGPGWNVRHCKDADTVAWAGVFTAPEAGCLYEEAWGHSIDDHAGLGAELDHFASGFYLHTVPWMLLNQRKTLRHIHQPGSYEVHFEGDLVSKVSTPDRHYTLTQGDRVMVDGTDLCMEAVWTDDKCIAYSKSGCDKTWQLPDRLRSASQLKMTQLYPLGNNSSTDIAVSNGSVKLKLEPGQAMLLEKR